MRCLHLIAVGLTLLCISYICPAFSANHNPLSKEEFCSKGDELFNQGKFDDADKFYDSALSIDKNYSDAHRGKCNAARALHRCSIISSCCEKAYDLDQSKKNLALVTENLEAEACLRQTQGSDQYESEPYETALRIYDKFLTQNRNDSSAWNNKGIALGDLNRFNEALDCFNEAIKINSSSAEAWNNIGVSLDKINRHEEALEKYNKSININSKLAEAWYNKGKTLGLNDASFREARKCYLNATEIDPMLKSKGEMLDWIYKKA
jgi:tetratricopeptide (TPR) repeat protein